MRNLEARFPYLFYIANLRLGESPDRYLLIHAATSTGIPETTKIYIQRDHKRPQRHPVARYRSCKKRSKLCSKKESKKPRSEALLRGTSRHLLMILGGPGDASGLLKKLFCQESMFRGDLIRLYMYSYIGT